MSVQNISAAAGSQAVLPCKSYRMVWTQDRLNDRQRVVHWDVYSSYYGDNKMERLCDMYSAGAQRVYSSYNQGRIFMPQNAFTDGNFSLVIKGTKQHLFFSCDLQNGGIKLVFSSENGYFTEYFLSINKYQVIRYTRLSEALVTVFYLPLKQFHFKGELVTTHCL